MVRRRARAAWEALDSYFGSDDSSTTKLDIHLPVVEQVELAGFHVRILNAKDDYKEYIWQIEKSLELFRKRGMEVCPWLVRYALPFVITYDKESGDYAGRYEGDHILISGWWGAQRNPKAGVKVIAHEMSHHMWHEYLSDWDTSFWYAALKSDYGNLDLQKVLDVWPENGGDYWIVDHPLKDIDPTLYLQIYMCMHPDWGSPKFKTRSDLESLIAGGTTEIVVPKHPITVYANKNSDEAFCEALGMLVAYGPRAVPDLIQAFLRIILPNIRLASSKRVASRFLGV